MFEAEGLDGASLRAIAAAAGYSPAALYFHFSSKEAIYAEVLHAAIRDVRRAVDATVAVEASASGRLRAAALALFLFYEANPRVLDLGFYLLRGGMKPKGLGRERDEALNAAFAATLRPIADAAREMGASPQVAEELMVATFAHAAGLLLLAHTGRIRLFGVSAPALMASFVDERIAVLAL